MPTDAKSASALAGATMRTVRQAADRTQDQVAAAARHIGLPWSRATVAAIETGRRELSLGEAAVTPWLLYFATGTRVALQDLFGGDAAVQVRVGDECRPTVAAIRRGLRGDLEPEPGDFSPPWLTELTRGVSTAAGRAVAQAKRDDTGRLAEKRAADRLGISSSELVEAAYSLWGRGLTAERDERLDGLKGDRATAGHVTRHLLEELRGTIARPT